MSHTNVNPFGPFSKDKIVEDYYQYLHENAHTQIRACFWIGIVMTLVVFALDSYYFSEEQLPQIRLVRVIGLVPMCLLLIFGGLAESFRWVYWAAAISLVSLTWSFLASDFSRPVSFFSYYYLLSLPTTLLTYTLFRVQFRFGLMVATPVNIVIVYALFNVDIPRTEQLVLAFGVISIYVSLMATMYYRERSEREKFVLEHGKIENLERQALADRERAQWYQTFSQFIRHELASYLVGIRTSFELLDRFPDQRSKYSARGQQSLREMQVLMRQAAEATSIDEALLIEERERFDLSAVVRDCVDEYSSVYTDITFDVSLDKDLDMEGQAYRIRQLLDKLVSNAARHQSGEEPVTIRLARGKDIAELVVENRGDALPVDTDIFALWTKGDRGAEERRHGLGLYVAKKIADAHGGSIDSLALSSPSGARFSVTLPLL